MKINDARPGLFEKSTCGIWTDPHIQRQMLHAHLDPISDAASRKPEAIDITCKWIASQIAPASRVLDLGCGPGLYAAKLAEMGHLVTGIDLNAQAVDHAKNHYPAITFIEGDYLKDFPSGEFDVIILIYCDFGTHSDEEREKLLRHCASALVPGGKLFFDFFPLRSAAERREEKRWEYCKAGGFWAPDEYLLLEQTFHYPEHSTWANQYNLICEEEIRHFIVWERYFQPKEISAMLGTDGFGSISFTDGVLPVNDFTFGNEVFVTAIKE